LKSEKKNIKYVFSNTGYDYDSTSIRRPFDARSTRYQKSLRSPWRSISVAAGPLAAVTLTYLFIYLGPSAAAHTQVGPRSSSRSSNGRSAVELQSNSTCNHRLSSSFVQRFQKNWDPKQLQYIQQPQTCNKIKFKKNSCTKRHQHQLCYEYFRMFNKFPMFMASIYTYIIVMRNIDVGILSVCPSLHLSVTVWSCVENGSTSSIFSPPGRPVA